MGVRRLRWQARGRQQALARVLQQDLKLWLEAWSVDPQLLSLRLIAATDDSEPGMGWCWWRASGQTGSLWPGARAQALEALGALLAGAGSGDSLGLGQRIGERALRALMTVMLAGPSNEPQMQIDSAPGRGERDPRFGGCGFWLEGHGFDAQLWLDHDLCELRLPTPRGSSIALSPLASAVSPESVLLEVLLDFGQASLAETQGLQVGDVLVSSTPLNSLFLLAQANHRALAGARLFRQGERRALQVDSLPLSRTAP